MKDLIAASALSLCIATSSVTAGSLAEPVVSAPVIVEEASASSGGPLIPLMILALGVIVLSSGNNGGGGGVISDARLKTDITPAGTTTMGIPLYHYRYIGGHQTFEGVMAQDVARIMPEAIIPIGFGYMAVNYDMLGIEMHAVN